MKCGIHTRFQVYSTETCQTIAKPDNHARNPGKHRTITCNRHCKQSNPHRNPSPRIFNRPTTIASMQLFTRASSHVDIPVNNRKSQAFASMTLTLRTIINARNENKLNTNQHCHAANQNQFSISITELIRIE